MAQELIRRQAARRLALQFEYMLTVALYRDAAPERAWRGLPAACDIAEAAVTPGVACRVVALAARGPVTPETLERFKEEEL